jgi:hypothetical protein
VSTRVPASVAVSLRHSGELYCGEAAASQPGPGRVSFAMALCSVSLWRLWRGRNASIGCSLPRRTLFNFCSEPMRGDGRLLSRSNSDQTCQGPSYREGGAEFTRTLQRAARRDRLGIWTFRVTQRFRALGIRLRLKPKDRIERQGGRCGRRRDSARAAAPTRAAGRTRRWRPQSRLAMKAAIS